MTGRTELKPWSKGAEVEPDPEIHLRNPILEVWGVGVGSEEPPELHIWVSSKNHMALMRSSRLYTQVKDCLLSG